MDETAKILGISVAAANARLFHARASLRGNKALLLNHKAARHVSRKRFSCAMRLYSTIRSVGSLLEKQIPLETSYQARITNYCWKTGGGPLIRFT